MENKKTLGEIFNDISSKVKNFFQQIKTDKKHRNVFIAGGVIAGVLLVALVTLAIPPSVWFTLTSNNCLTQGTGNTMVEAPGAGVDSNRNFIYVAFGGSASFKRFDPRGIAGGTGDCEVTTLAAPPSGSFSGGATMTKLNNNTLLVTLGSSTPIWFYFINQNVWLPSTTARFQDTATADPILPYTGPAGDERQADGNAITSVGQEIFIANGCGSSSGCPSVFAKYNTVSNTWTDLSPVAPTTLAGTKFAPVGTTIFALAGGSVFRKFDTTANTWTTLVNTPAALAEGAALAYDGGNYVYAFRGGNFNNFWRYDVNQAAPGTWDTALARAPELIYDGGYLAYPGTGEYMYAFQGNGSTSFWRYCMPGSSGCTGNTWDTTSLAQAPAKIRSGSALTWDGGDYFYATRGNATKDFWRYCLPGASTCTPNTWQALPATPVAVGASTTGSQKGGLTYVCASGTTCPGTGTVWMTSGNADWRTGTTNSHYPLFRFPLSGTNAGKWPIFTPASFVSGPGVAIAYPGPSAEDPTGDFFYNLWGNNSTGFTKHSLSRSEPIPWNRSQMNYTNQISGLLDSTALLTQPNFAGSNYQQGLGTSGVDVNGKIYFVNGNSTSNFSSFDPVLNIWEELSQLPGVTAASGASIAKKDNQNLYVTLGNTSQRFFRFFIPTKEWIQYTRGKLENGMPIPQNTAGGGVGHGNTITVNNGKLYIYGGNAFEIYNPVTNSLTRATSLPIASAGGSDSGTAFVSVGTDIYSVLNGPVSTAESLLFARYDTITNLWTTLTSLPAGSPQENTGAGASVVYVSSQNKIYAFKGNNSRQFFAYDIGAGTWSPATGAGSLALTPEGIGGGGSLVALGTDLFAFSGNNSRNFWRYDATQATPGTWVTLTNPPPSGVTAGASLTTDGTNIYATKGNLTKTFWKYTITNTPNPGDGTWSQLTDSPVRVGSNCANTNPCTDGRGEIIYYNNAGSDEIWMVPATGLANNESSSTSSDGGILFRYKISDNTWPHFPKPSQMPAIINSTGSSLTYPGTGDLLYFLRGSATTDLWSYDTVNNIWLSTIRGKFDDNTVISQNNLDPNSLPANHSLGSTIIEANNELYIVPGGGSVTTNISPFTFQKFNPVTNVWTNLADIPTTSSSSGAYEGATFTSRDTNGDTIIDTLYFFKGNFSTDFWRYDIPTNTWFSFNIAKKDDGTPISQFSGMGPNQQQFNGNKIVELNGKFYVATGNTTGVQFEKYDPVTNTWTALPNPYMLGFGVQTFTFGTGTSLIKVGNQVYAIANTNIGTTYIEKYDPAANTWTYVAQMPVQAGAGASIAYHGDIDTVNANSRDFIFYLRGANSLTIYRYCLQNSGSGCTVGAFTALTNTPATVQGGGSITSMTVAGTPYLYVMRGNNTTDFWRWNILNAAAGAWDTLAGNGTPETVFSGGALTNDGTYIYATRGGNNTSGGITSATKTFWKYDPLATSGSRWSKLENVPAKMGEASVSSDRGGLTYCSTCGTGEIWAVTGNGRYGFRRDSNDVETGGLIFRYKIADNTWPIYERTAAAPAVIQGGSALSYPGSGDFVYGFQGGGNASFWSYDHVMNEWNAFIRSKLDTGKPLSQLELAQGAGNSIVQANGKFYVLPGNSNRFFQYNQTTNKWTELSSTPTNVTVGDGASMAVVDANGDTIMDDIYILRGGSTNVFWKYNLALGAWTTLTVVPATVDDGGAITYPGSGDYLFALRGTNTGTFYKYCFKSSGSTPDATTCAPAQVGFWSGGGTPAITTPAVFPNGLTGAPLNGVQGGGALVSVGGNIYALRGAGSLAAGTSDFRKYVIATDTWDSTLTFPTWTSAQNVTSGGALTTDGTDIYALKGDGDPDVRKYTVGTNTWSNLQNLPANVGTNNSNTTARGGLTYTPTGPSGGGELWAVSGNGTITTTSSPVPTIFRFPFTGTNANTWPVNEVPQSAPGGISAGGSLLAMDNNNIYAIQGGTNTNFWLFDIVANEWTPNTLTKGLIDGIHRISQSGATQGPGSSIVQVNGKFYVLAGNSTTTFQEFNPTTNRWRTLATVPTTPSNVGDGGSLVAVPTCANGQGPTSPGVCADLSTPTINTIYAISGNTTLGFHKYNIATNTWSGAIFTAANATDILTSTAHGLAANTAITVNSTGGSVPTGLTANTVIYYVINPTTDTFQVSLTPGGAAVNFTTDGTGTLRWVLSTPATIASGGSLGYPGSGNFIYAFRGVNTTTMFKYDITQSGGSWTTGATFINSGPDVLTSTAHGLPAGAAITVSTTGTLPTGLTAGTIYYIIGPTADDFMVSTTKGGPAVLITSAGSGTHSWAFSTPWTVQAGGSMIGISPNLYVLRGNNFGNFSKFTINASGNGSWSGANFTAANGTDQLTSVGHGLTVDTSIVLSNTGGALPTGLTANQIYYVINTTGADVFQVSSTRGGSAVNFTTDGTGTQTWMLSAPWVVQSGGSLTTDGTQIYASRGSATTEIRKYCTTTDGDCNAGNWAATNIAAFPVNLGTATLNNARGGIAYIASGTSGGAELFGISGNGFTGNNAGITQAVLYRYIFASNSWPTAAPTPVTPGAPYGGASLTKYDNTTLYASQGNNATGIWRFNVPNNRWNNIADAPPGATAIPTPAPVNIGTSSARGGIAYSPGLNELFMISGFGATDDQGGTDTLVRTGLLFRHPFTGINAHTWPIVGALAPAPAAVSSTGGAALAADGTNLYAFQGGNTAFWRYNIPNNRWNNAGDGGTPLALPAVTGSGSSMTTDGGGTNIWASRGNNTAEIFRYNTGTNTWTPQSGGGSLANAPFSFGVSNQGGGLVYSNNDLWGFSGRGYTNFTDVPTNPGTATGILHRYDIAGNTWPVLFEAADAPTSPQFVTFYGGSDLATTPDALKIFALRGAFTPTVANPNLWVYNVSATSKGTWTALPNMPNNTTPFDILSGGSLVAIDNATLFATKGGGNTDFYRFNYNSVTPASSTWLAKGPVPIGTGTNSQSEDRGELLFSSQYGSVFFTSGNDTTSPFSIYSYPLLRTVVTCVTAAADVAETQSRCAGGPVTPIAGQPIGAIVQTLDFNDTPVNVTANTDVRLSVKTGSGTLGGTITGTIPTGQNSGVVHPFTYSVADGGVILSASDITSPPNLATYATSDSDPFNVDPATPSATTLVTNPVSTPVGGPTGGRTGVQITGNNFYTHYKQPITLTSGTALTDYQFPVTIDTARLIAAGKMRPDCGDIRFTDTAPSVPYTATNPANILPYWTEFGCNTPITKFWVKVTSITPLPASSTIYINYGDLRATSASSGTNTFTFFDDFAGTTLNTSKWTQVGTAAQVSVNERLFLQGSASNFGIYSIVDGTDGAGDGNTDFDRANSPALEFDYHTTSFSTLLMGWKDTTNTLGGTSTAVGSGGFIHAMNANSGGTSDLYDPTPTAQNSDNSQIWTTPPSYKIRVIMRSAADGNGAIYQRSPDNGHTWINYKTTTVRTDALARIAFSNSFAAGDIDNVRVRKYTATEPTAVFGDESPTLKVEFAAGAGPVPGTVHSVTPTSIIASSPVHPVTVSPIDVIVTNADNQTTTIPASFEFFSPSITQIDPDNGIPDGGTNVTITGNYFNPSGYARTIDITNAGTALTNYQIPITIDTVTPIAQGKMRLDGGDIRFWSDINMTVPLSYFIEGPMNSGLTKIWVKVTNVPAGASTIYISYGNPLLTSQSSAANTFVREIDNLSLKGNWSMDETSGTTSIADSSGFGNTSTMNGTNSTVAVAGKFGNARNFNGTDNFATTAGNADTLDNINAGISVEYWFKLNATPSNLYRIVSKGCASSVSGWEMMFGFNSGYKPRFYVRDSNNGDKNFGTLAGTAIPALGTWHHVIGTFEPSNITGSFYYDGVIQETLVMTGTVATSSNTLPVTIGRCLTNTSMNGIIDEVRIYNKGLTAAEVSDLYNNYGYTTTLYPGRVLVKKIPAPGVAEPTTLILTERGTINVAFDTSFIANVFGATLDSINLFTPDHDPPGAATVPVVVTNAGDGATSSTSYIYGIPPQITPPLSPDEGDISGGTAVTINGSDFSNTPDPDHPGQNLEVTFDGVATQSISFVNSAQLDVTTPAHPATGLVDVVVTNPNTQRATLVDGFTYTTIPDPNNSTVTAVPTIVEGDGQDTGTITVQLLDNSAPIPQPAPNRTVRLEEILQTPGTSFIDAVNCTTGISLGNIPPYEGTSGVNGRVCFKVRTEPASTISTTLGTYEFRATDITTAPIIITDTATVDFVSLITDKEDSTFTAPAGTIAADGVTTKTLTATIKNKNGVAIEAKNVSILQTSGPVGGTATITPVINPTDSSGVATFTVSTTKAGTYTFTATETTSEPDVVLDDVADLVTVDFVAGDADPNTPHSTLETDIASALGNGIASATLKATLRDVFDNPVIDKTVVFAQTAGPGTATITPVICPVPEIPGSAANKTNTEGKACATVKTISAGTYTFNVTETDSNPDITLTQTVNVIFTGPSAADSTLTATPATVAANGTSSSTVTATLLDSTSNPFPGRTVVLSKLSGNGTPTFDAINCSTLASLGSGATSTTDSLGRACYKVRSINRATYVLRANNSTEGFFITQTVTIEYTDGIIFPYTDGQSIANAVDDDSTYKTPSQTKVIRTTDGNFITAWLDDRNSSSGSIFAQKYDSSGSPQWTTNGVQVGDSTSAFSLQNLYILDDNAGGAVITWMDTTSGMEVRGQRVNGSGTLVWAPPYKVLVTGLGYSSGSSTNYYAIEDGEGGIFIGYRNNSISYYDYVTRINSSGDMQTGDTTTWPAQLSTLGYQCSGGTSTILSLIRPGVVRAAWTEPSTTNCGLGTTYSLRTTSLNTLVSGDFLTTNTVSTANSTAPSDLTPYPCSFTAFFQAPRQMVEDGNGGAYILFHEDCLVSTSSTSDDEMLYVNHLGAGGSGIPQWSYQLTTTGSIGSGAQGKGDMISDGAGGAILTFTNAQANPSGLPLPVGGVYAYRIKNSATNTVQHLWNSGNRITINLGAFDSEIVSGPSSGMAYIVDQETDPTSTYNRAIGKLFNSDGSYVAGWSPGGLVLSSVLERTHTGFDQGYNSSKRIRQVVADGSGGIVFASEGETHGFTNTPYILDYDNFIQKISSAGVLGWNGGIDPEISPTIDTQNTVMKAQQNHQIVASSGGDFIVAWEDEADQTYFGSTLNPFSPGITFSRRTFTGQYTPVADKIGSDGISKWDSTYPGRGVAGIYDDTGTSTNHTELKIAADQTSNSPNGGLLMAWTDFITGGNRNILIQKLNSNGKRNATWNISENGRTMASGAVNHTPDIISDGAGGGYLTWTKDGTGAGSGVFVTKFNSSDGAVNGTWGIQNPALASANFDRQNPKLLRDVTNNWVYDIFETKCIPSGNALSVYILQYNASTGVLWGSVPLGSVTCPISGPEFDFQDAIVAGNYVFVAYRRGDNSQIYVQKYSSATGVPSVWSGNGFQVSSTANNNTNAVLATDNNGGVIIAWEQYNAASTASDIAVQRLNSSGAKMWADGLFATNSAVTALKQNPKIIKDGTNSPYPTNGGVITWSQENPTPPGRNIFAQRIVNGIKQWGANGTQLSSLTTRTDTIPLIIGDNNGGGTVAWQGQSSPPDIFGQSMLESDHSFNSTFTRPTLDNIIANGTDSELVTATLLDQNNQPVPGRTISISVTSGIAANTTITPAVCASGGSVGVTNSSGQVCAVITSPVAATYTYAASDTTDAENYVTISQTVNITFIPVPAPSLTCVAGVIGGDGLGADDFSMAIMYDGSIWAWGDDLYGQLGNDAAILDSNVPVPVLGMTDIVSFDSGYLYGIAIKSDGTMWGWGNNSSGQLGDGTLVWPRRTPVQSQAGFTGAVQIAAGWGNTNVLRNDGTVWAWGDNSHGELGTGTYTDSLVPVQVVGPTGIGSTLQGIVQISGAYDHTLALKSDGTVYVWGDGAYGQLGNGTFAANSPVPVQVTGLTDVVEVEGGVYHSYARKSDGTIWAWGADGNGQLGNGLPLTNSSVPVQVTGLTGMLAVAGGGSHGMGLTATNTVMDWGYNLYGSLGNGNNTDTNVPVGVLNISDITAISGAAFHSLAMERDGTVWAWGYNGNGELGDGTNTNRNTPVQVTGLPTCAIDPDSGPSTGGTLVTIRGTNFQPGVPGTTVTFGGTAGINVTVVDENTITVETPAHTSGTVDVVVTNPDAQSDTRTNGFTYTAPPPTVSVVIPSFGDPSGGTNVTITGSNFQTSGTTTVTFGGAAATNVIVVDELLITATTPVHPSGTVDVVVTNPDGQTGTLPGGFTYIAPPAFCGSFIQIQGGASHSVGLTIDGTVWTWGKNDGGQLGDGTNTDSNVPVQVSGLTGITAISSTEFHVMALKSDGTVWTWGWNDAGMLGNGTTTNSNVPIQISGLSNITAIYAGRSHSLAVENNNTVWAWGRNLYGQLGDGTNTLSLTPVQVSGLTGITAVGGGLEHSLARKNDGTVWAWGYNVNGQLGDATNTNRNTPVQVSGLTGVTAVAASGYAHSMALKSDGTVWAWGWNSYGSLGDGTNTSSNVPVQVSGLTGVTAIDVGGYHSLAVKNDGTVWTWGLNDNGQLGNGTITNSNVPIQVSGLTGATTVSGGLLHSLAIKNDGTGWAWGHNFLGQLGDGTTNVRYAPVQVQATQSTCINPNNGPPGGGTNITISGANFQTTGTTTVTFEGTPATNVTVVDANTITATTPAHAPGAVNVVITNPDGQSTISPNGFTYLGPPPTVDLVIPSSGATAGGTDVSITGTNFQTSGTTTVTFGGVAATNITVVDANTITATSPNVSTGTVDVVVTNPDAQSSTLTNGFTFVPAPSFCGFSSIAAGDYNSIAIKPTDGSVWGANSAFTQLYGVTNAIQIDGGYFYEVALLNDGTVQALGTNTYGQLGNGTTIDSPGSWGTPIAGLTDVTAISAGSGHVLALKGDGTVWAWGANINGQIGDNSTTNRTTPVQVSGLTDVIEISAGGTQSLAVKNDGTVWAWGFNGNGQLGDGTFIERHTPVQVSGLTGVTKVSGGGYYFSLALKSDGTVWAWGDNFVGKLGNGGVGAMSNIPVQVSGLSNITDIAAGGSHSLALKNDGIIWAWGSNATGQLGIGTTTDSNVPVRVTGVADVTAIDAGVFYSLALEKFGTDGPIWAWGSNANGFPIGQGAPLSGSNVPIRLRTGLNGCANPQSGPTSGGTDVTITGQNFQTSGTTTVTFDGILATNVNVIDSTTLTATTPAHNVGYVPVTITNPDGQNDTAYNTYLNGYLYVSTVNPGSTIAADPTSVAANGTTASRITVTLLNNDTTPVVGHDVQVYQTSGSGTATIQAVPCNIGDTAGVTNTDGEACFDTTSTDVSLDTFGATDVTDSITLTSTADVEFICDVGSQGSNEQQCAVIGITPQTGSLSITEVPDSFSFPASYAGGESFNNSSGSDDADRVTLSDTRNSGGFTLQLQATTPFADTLIPTHTIPLTNLYTATSTIAEDTRDANGIACNGVQYLGPAYDSLPDCSTFPALDTITANFDILGGYGTASSYTGLSGNTLDAAVDLMVTLNNHDGSFSQFVNYYLTIPAGQDIGNYEVTLTFTAF